jgi:hypothetical protein
MTYKLEVERECDVSDCGCYKEQERHTPLGGDVRSQLRRQNKDRDDIPTRGEEGRHVRLQLKLQTEGRDDIPTGGGEGDVSDRGCNYKMRGGTTYSLEVEMSDCSRDYKTRTGTTYILEVEREATVRSQLCLQNEGRDNLRTGGGEAG